jgi:hypothetical protein
MSQSLPAPALRLRHFFWPKKSWLHAVVKRTDETTLQAAFDLRVMAPGRSCNFPAARFLSLPNDLTAFGPLGKLGPPRLCVQEISH